MARVVEVTDEDFESEVIDFDGYVFVDFWGPDCESCEFVAPFFKQAADEFDGQIRFVTAFAEDAPVAHEAHGVEAYPKLALFFNGQEVAECVADDDSVPDFEIIRDFLTAHLDDGMGDLGEDEE